MTFACETPPTGAAAALAGRAAAMVPVVETARLTLRAPAVGDFPAYAGIARGPRAQYIGGPMTRADAWTDFAAMAAGWLLHGHGLWTIADRDGGAVLGFVLIGFEPGDAEPELGFLLTAEAEGRGIAEEAARAARGWAFDDLGRSTLVSYIDPANTRSIALANRLGAVAVGTLTGPDGGEPAAVYRHLRGEALA